MLTMINNNNNNKMINSIINLCAEPESVTAAIDNDSYCYELNIMN